MKTQSFLKALILLTLTLSSLRALAQTAPSIRSGRPGQSIGPFVVGTGLLQLQSGVEGNNTKNAGEDKTLLLNNVLRLGLSESFEVSGVFNYNNDKFNQVAGSSEQKGISSLQFGFRYNIISQSDGWVPALGIQTRFKSTATANAYRSTNLAPIFILVSSHKLNESSGLTFNFGMNYDGQSPVVQHFYTANYAYSLPHNFGTFLEIYGNEKSGLKKNYIDTGLSYLANNDLQWDLSFGGGNNHSVKERFVSLGLSYRCTVF